jgi:hypothetical protein
MEIVAFKVPQSEGHGLWKDKPATHDRIQTWGQDLAMTVCEWSLQVPREERRGEEKGTEHETLWNMHCSFQYQIMV